VGKNVGRCSLGTPKTTVTERRHVNTEKGPTKAGTVKENVQQLLSEANEEKVGDCNEKNFK